MRVSLSRVAPANNAWCSGITEQPTSETQVVESQVLLWAVVHSGFHQAEFHLVRSVTHTPCLKIAPVPTGWGHQGSGKLPALLSSKVSFSACISGDGFERKSLYKLPEENSLLPEENSSVSLKVITQHRKPERRIALWRDCLFLIDDHTITVCLPQVCAWKLHRHDINHLRFPSNNVTPRQHIQ